MTKKKYTLTKEEADKEWKLEQERLRKGAWYKEAQYKTGAKQGPLRPEASRATQVGQKHHSKMDYIELDRLLAGSGVPIYQSIPPTKSNRKDIASVPFALDAEERYKDRFPGKENLLFPDILRKETDWLWTTWTMITRTEQTSRRGGIFQCGKCPGVGQERLGKMGVYGELTKAARMLGPQKMSFCTQCNRISNFRKDKDTKIQMGLYKKQKKGIKPKRGDFPYFAAIAGLD